MLFDSLDRMKRSTIMLTIVLMIVGWALLLMPGEYVPFLSSALGFFLLVSAVVSVLTFAESSKALISYVRLVGGLLGGTVGLMLYLIDGAFVALLTILMTVVPVVLGLYGIFHAFAFARRSGRRGWWVLVVFSCFLLVFALFSLLNPWAGDAGGTIKVIGGAIMYSALVIALSLVWIWPFRHEEEA